MIRKIMIVCSAMGVANAAENVPTFSLGNLWAKTYVAKPWSYGHTSSKSFFVVAPGDTGKMVVLDRRKKYVPYSEHGLRLSKRHTPSIAIVADEYLVTTGYDLEGKKQVQDVWVNKIGEEQDAKNIDLGEPINEIGSMSCQGNYLLGKAYKKGIFTLDLLTEKIVHTFKPGDKYAASMLSDSSGNGVWYAASHHGSDTHVVAHCDLRSAKDTMSVTMPAMVYFVSVNQSDTRWATCIGNKIHLYDVTAGKFDRPHAVQKNHKISGSCFPSDDVLMYDTKVAGDLTLHTLSISSGDIDQKALPSYISGVSYHANTGLVVGSRFLIELGVYDFGLKK